MVERICPACQHGNPMTDKFCGQCGTALERLLPVAAPRSPLTIAGRQVPAHWQQIGKAAAVSVAALAADVGLAWLRRRLEGGATVSTAPAPLAVRQRHDELAKTAVKVTTIISQRVIELIDTGDGKPTLKDTHVWRRIDE